MLSVIMRSATARLLLCIVLLAVCSSALDRQPGTDYRARRVALSQKTSGGIVIMFSAVEGEGRDSLFGFRQDDNFYYLSGVPFPGAALLIAPEVQAAANTPARAYTEILFLPDHNRVQEKWTGPKLGPEDAEAKQYSGFDRIESLDKMRDIVSELMGTTRARVYTDIAEGDESSPSTAPMAWLHRANAFPGGGFGDVKPFLVEMRARKDAGEIEMIRRATLATVAAHRAAWKAIKPGMKEYQVAALMQYEYQNRGCERAAYAPIVGSGFNSTVLHYSDNSKTIDPGDLIVMDVAGEYSMYASDVTRTVPASGKFTARQREIYDIVLGAQRAAIEAFVAGKSTLTGDKPESLYKVAYDYINSHGKDLKGQPLGQYFIHGLGHPVGLEVHDVAPGAVLDRGSVFTLEPGIYIPEEKLGVRIEDIFYVDSNGKLVAFSADLPKTAAEIEAAMGK